jgi:hypothetical protein
MEMTKAVGLFKKQRGISQGSLDFRNPVWEMTNAALDFTRMSEILLSGGRLNAKCSRVCDHIAG